MKIQFVLIFASRVLSAVIQALAIILLARWVDVQVFGYVSIVLGTSAVIFGITDWGLSSFVPRARAKGQHALVRAGLRFHWQTNLVAGTAVATVVGVTMASNGDLGWLCLLPFALALEQVVEIRLTVKIADGSRGGAMVSVLLRRIVSFGVFVLLFFSGLGAVASYGLSMVVGAVVGWVHVVFLTRSALLGRTRNVRIGEIIPELVPLWIANLSSQSRTLDVAIVGGATSVAAAGLYSAAFRFSNPLMLAAGAAVSVVLPHSARISLHDARKLGRRIALIVSVASLPLLIPMFYAREVLSIFFGQEFEDARIAFVFALAVVPFMSVAWPLGGILQGQGFQKFVALNASVFAIINLLAILLGAAFWGASGAAAGLAVVAVARTISLFVRLQFAPVRSREALV